MSLDISPEIEQLFREELTNGHFGSVDQFIVESVQAWHERGQTRKTKKLTVQEFHFWMEELAARSQDIPSMPGVSV